MKSHSSMSYEGEDYTLLTLDDIDKISLDRAKDALRYMVGMLPSWGVKRGQFQIFDLSLELLFEIFSHCDFERIWSLAFSCKRMYELIWGDDDAFFTRKNKAGGRRLLQAYVNSRGKPYSELPPLGETLTLGADFGGILTTKNSTDPIDPSGEYYVSGYRFSLKTHTITGAYLLPTSDSEKAISQKLNLFFRQASLVDRDVYTNRRGTLKIKKGRSLVRHDDYIQEVYLWGGGGLVVIHSGNDLLNEIGERGSWRPRKIDKWSLEDAQERNDGRKVTVIAVPEKSDFDGRIHGYFNLTGLTATSDWWEGGYLDKVIYFKHSEENKNMTIEEILATTDDREIDDGGEGSSS